MFFSLKAVLISSDLDGNHLIWCSDGGGGVAWRVMARRAPDVPLHIRLREPMDESRLSWIDFLHEYTQKRRERTTEERRAEDDEPEHGATRGQKTKGAEFVRKQPTVRREDNTTVNEWNATVSPPRTQEIRRRR